MQTQPVPLLLLSIPTLLAHRQDPTAQLAQQILGKHFQYAVTELCDDCMGYVYTDSRTIQLQDGYEPTMGVSPLFGTYLVAWMEIFFKQLRPQLNILKRI